MQMKYTKYYNGVLYFRKLIFAVIIVQLNNFPYTQLGLICVLNGGMIWYIFYLHPIEKPLENFKSGCGEVILLVI